MTPTTLRSTTSITPSKFASPKQAYPGRYKRFIVSGDGSHTALQNPLFNTQSVDGVPLNEWTDDFLVPRPFWVDLVEEFIPFP